jgi:hypothetical protein
MYVIREGGEAVGHARRDEHAPAVGLADLQVERGAIGGRPFPQVVEHHQGVALGEVPVVGLVQVVVEADDGAGDLVGAVPLHHLPPVREP